MVQSIIIVSFKNVYNQVDNSPQNGYGELTGFFIDLICFSTRCLRNSISWFDNVEFTRRNCICVRWNQWEISEQMKRFSLNETLKKSIFHSADDRCCCSRLCWISSKKTKVGPWKQSHLVFLSSFRPSQSSVALTSWNIRRLIGEDDPSRRWSSRPTTISSIVQSTMNSCSMIIY